MTSYPIKEEQPSNDNISNITHVYPDDEAESDSHSDTDIINTGSHYVDKLPSILNHLPPYSMWKSLPIGKPFQLSQVYKLITQGDLSKVGDSHLPGPSSPLTTGIKRPAASELQSETPHKLVKIGPTGNIQISRTYSNSVAVASESQVASGNSHLPVTASPAGHQTQLSLATTNVSPTVSSSSAPSMENVSSEEKEYLRKMGEQRKKREEVIRLKEERRRQQLDSQSGNGKFVTWMETTSPPINKNGAYISPALIGRAQRVESACANTSYSQIMTKSYVQHALTIGNVASFQQRKTQLVNHVKSTGMIPALVNHSTNYVIDRHSKVPFDDEIEIVE